MIITIDGPAGSGKSTVARRLARVLGIAHLDTGATYRAATLHALRGGVDLLADDALAEATAAADIRLEDAGDTQRAFLSGEDVSDEIRTSRVTDNVHYIANSPAVRDVLVALQRRIGHGLGSFVSEGRDQGSVVFPDADVKFFLDASPEIRAERRLADLVGAGEAAEFEAVLQAIIDRDRRDETRPVAPLVRPAGAIEIDTSEMTVDTVVDTLRKHVGAAT